jgi:hypothetical protein
MVAYVFSSSKLSCFNKIKNGTNLMILYLIERNIEPFFLFSRKCVAIQNLVLEKFHEF